MWAAFNGILQGCGLTVVIFNTPASIWLKALECEAPQGSGVVGRGYADDVHGQAKTRKGVEHIVLITAEYAELTGQEISVSADEKDSKSYAFANDEEARKELREPPLELGGVALVVRDTLDLLGTTQALGGAKRGRTGKTKKNKERAAEVRRRAERLGHAPIGFDGRATYGARRHSGH